MEGRASLWRRLRGSSRSDRERRSNTDDGSGASASSSNDVRGREVGRLRSDGGRIATEFGDNITLRTVSAVFGRRAAGNVGDGRRTDSMLGRMMTRMFSCVGAGNAAAQPSGSAPNDSTTTTAGGLDTDQNDNGDVATTAAAERTRPRRRSEDGNTEDRRRARHREVFNERPLFRERERIRRELERAGIHNHGHGRNRVRGRRSRARDAWNSGNGNRGLDDVEFLVMMNHVIEAYRTQELADRQRMRERELLAGAENARRLEEMLESLPTFVIEKGGIEATEKLFGTLRAGEGRVESVEDIVTALEGPVEAQNVDARDGECVICLGGYEVGDEVMILPCTPIQHYFHADCIRTWMRKTPDCPCCRTELKYRQATPENVSISVDVSDRV